MWGLYCTAKTTNSRPSALVGIPDAWAALMFDNAVTFVGTVIENASQEQHNIGSEKQPKYELKYDMHQLLDPAFKLPAPLTKEQKDRQRQRDAINMLRGLAGRGVKVFKTA